MNAYGRDFAGKWCSKAPENTAFDRKHLNNLIVARADRLRKCIQLLPGWCYTSEGQTACKNPESKYNSVRRLAAKEETSLSLKSRDLIKNGLKAQEDKIAAHVSMKAASVPAAADIAWLMQAEHSLVNPRAYTGTKEFHK
jgi:hypothetical protein